MTTNGRTSRFPNYTMGNGSRDDSKSSQTIPSSFATTSASTWQQNGIWAPNPIGSAFNVSKRDATGSRGSDDRFPLGLTGSGALAAASEADSTTWPNRAGPWNAPENPKTRPGSGDTSPNRAREANGQPLNDNSPTLYFTTSRTLSQQNSFANPNQGRPAGAPGLRYPPAAFNDTNGDNDAAAPFGSIGAPTSGLESRAVRDNGYLNPVGGPSRDSNISSRQPEVERQPMQFGDTNMNGYNSFSSQTPNPTGSHRPNVLGHSASFPSQINHRAYNLNSNLHEEDLAARFSRSATIQEPIDSANSMSYVNAGAHPFQFNPGSQPFSVSNNKGFENGHHTVAYDPTTAHFLAKGGSGDRGPPAGAQFRSPKPYSDTPPSAVDGWSRPASKDPRVDLERSRNGQPPSYIAQQTPFYPTPYFPSFPQAFQAHTVYEPYAVHTAQAGYRPQMPVTPFTVHMPGFIQGAPSSGLPALSPLKDQNQVKGVRSALLEEFRSGGKSNKKYELKDIYGHVVEFSGDQHGSRFIQGKLEVANSDEKEQVFRELEPNAIQLMKDVFGNYVIQKFFEHGNQVQKKILAGLMKGKMVDLSCQTYSCRVVQKALEHVLVEQQAELVAELQPDVLRIIKDQNGNHVMQQVIVVVPGTYTKFVLDALRGSISQMAAHNYGCRIIQRLMEHGSEVDKAYITNEIHACAQFLVTDQYGNYVTQHILADGKPHDRHQMINTVVPQLLTLSKHKFASNVVEKCIEYSSDEDRQAILDQVYQKGSDGTSQLQLLIKDQYGNYIIQKFLNCLQGAERDRFVNELKPCVVAMRKVSTGRSVNALDKLLQLAGDGSPQGTPVTSAAGGLDSLHIDPHSATQTPVLTREPNTPQSSDPPSTTVSAVGDATTSEGTNKGQVNGTGTEAQIQVTDA